MGKSKLRKGTAMKRITGIMILLCLLLMAALTDPDRMHFDIFSEEAGGGISEGNDYFSVGDDGMPAQG